MIVFRCEAIFTVYLVRISVQYGSFLEERQLLLEAQFFVPAILSRSPNILSLLLQAFWRSKVKKIEDNSLHSKKKTKTNSLTAGYLSGAVDKILFTQGNQLLGLKLYTNMDYTITNNYQSIPYTKGCNKQCLSYIHIYHG